MSSWWSSLNPFAGVNAEEAQDDHKRESKDDGDENGTNPNWPAKYREHWVSLEDEESEEGGDEEEQEEEGGDDEDEEEEEEEDEPEDPKPALVERTIPKDPLHSLRLFLCIWGWLLK